MTNQRKTLNRNRNSRCIDIYFKRSYLICCFCASSSPSETYISVEMGELTTKTAWKDCISTPLIKTMYKQRIKLNKLTNKWSERSSERNVSFCLRISHSQYSLYSNFLSRVKSNPTLHCFRFTSLFDWSKKTRANLSTNQMQNLNQSGPGRPRFPAP